MNVSPQFFIMGAQRIAPTAEVVGLEEGNCKAIISRSSNLPDCIGPKQSHGPMLVNEKIASDLRDASITGLVLKEVKLTLEKNPNDEISANYFWLRAAGYARAFRRIYKRDESKLNFVKDVFDQGDSLVVQARRSPREFVVRWIIDEAEWEGSDLFNTQFPRMFGEICCTYPVVELALEKGWRGLAFTPFDSISRNYADLTALKKLPENWYPDNQPEF